MAKSQVDRMILALYKERPTVVDEDSKLIAAIWHNMGWDYTDTLYNNLKRMPQAETIARRRRVLHERGEIKYSEAAEARRYKKYLEVKDDLGYPVGSYIMTDTPKDRQHRADTLK